MKTSVLGINEVLFATVNLTSQLCHSYFSWIVFPSFVFPFYDIVFYKDTFSLSVSLATRLSVCLNVCLSVSVFGQSVFKNKFFFVKNLLELVLQFDLLEFLDIVMGLLTFFKAETEYVCTKSVVFFRKTLIGTTKWCGQMYFTTVRLL